MTGPMIEASQVEVVLFDLGGVVFTFDWQRALDVWSASSGVSGDELASRFVKNDDYIRYERGELTSGEYFALLRHALAIHVDLDVIEHGWNAIFGDLVPGITDVIAAVRASPYRIAALSNTNAAHAAVFGPRFAPVLADLGRIFASHELGHRKPEHACFAETCSRLGVEAGAVLFFDDTETNVTAAQDFGMQAVQVSNVANIRAAVAQLELPGV